MQRGFLPFEQSTVESRCEDPSDWPSHLQGLDWKANIRALDIELKSPYNDGWWESFTPRVIIEWPMMRKWATQTLKDCINTNPSTGRHISTRQKVDFLMLFRRTDPENLKWLVFTEPASSMVENLEKVQATKTNTNKHKDTFDAGSLGDDVWSLSAANVEPLPRGRHGETDESLEAIEESAFDWEPPELKSLDWRANMEALTMAMEQSLNSDWETTYTIYIRDSALRLWAKQTMIQCIEENQRLMGAQRKEFLTLFENVPRSYLRSVAFLSPISIVGNIEESQVKDEAAGDGEESEDDSESSVYL